MPTTSRIKDQTFLFTGTLKEFTRDEAESLVVANGGKVLSGVSGKLNYLVVGKDAGSKLVKAKSIGTVKIITEKEFLKMVPKSKVTSSKKKKDVNEQSVEDAEIIEIFGELLQEHTADILNVPNDFYAICLGDTD